MLLGDRPELRPPLSGPLQERVNLEWNVPDRWEYTWCELDLENGLVGDPRSPTRETIGERGARGWELVTVLNLSDNASHRYVAFFKPRVTDARQ